MRLVIPGGSAEIVAKQALVVQFVREAFSHYRPIAAIGDGAVLTGAAPLKALADGAACHPKAARAGRALTA
jgi:putative intracellular protease/amidase